MKAPLTLSTIMFSCPGCGGDGSGSATKYYTRNGHDDSVDVEIPGGCQSCFGAGELDFDGMVASDNAFFLDIEDRITSDYEAGEPLFDEWAAWKLNPANAKEVEKLNKQIEAGKRALEFRKKWDAEHPTEAA